MSARIKICGMTRPEHVQSAVAAGADAIGLNFVESSPRYVDVVRAAELAVHVTPYVTLVGVFVNASRERVEQVLSRVPLQCLQFQGDEDNAFCAGFGLPYIKALRVAAALDGAAVAARYPRAQGVQLDAAVAGRTGGTGTRFDWRWFPRSGEKPWILAGGLDAENVGAAIRELRPYAVDVSSGVESAPGEKDPARIAAFCAAVRLANDDAT